ncbi:hypothetical protein [Nesterenkonia halotolerans]|uniref:WXG100 family type VII secretion target n=1 Tax=Nesterenkonia halotolerans TaxID=225325 RepID=A0ABR9J5Z5_9MICC|nr:hypothetical protein [Nesterenkonia halotolerans]MBE1514418.1 hypothetical protein [Nesterenkonia halotolerans]
MSRVEIHQHGQTINLEATDPMVEALSVTMQLGLSKHNGIVIDGLVDNAPNSRENESMSLWVSSTAHVKFIFQPRTDPEETKRHVDVMTASLERGGRIHFSSSGPRR